MFRLLTLPLLLLSLSSLAQLNVVGDAIALGSDCYRLTEAIGTQQGAAWSDCTIDISEPFTMDFTVYLGNNNGGADGIAWVLQQIGPEADNPSDGGGIGYDANPPYFNPALIIEFDTYQNGWAGDPSYDHLALQRDGSGDHTGPDCIAGCPPNTIQASATAANIEDGQDHDVHIEWDPVAQILTMDFDGQERINASVDLVGDLFPGNPNVYWGFTGSTGGANNVQEFCVIATDFSSDIGIEDITFDPPGPYAVCPGETVTVTASVPSGSVAWASSGTATLTAGVGDHLVQANATGCPQTETITIEELPSPNLSTAPSVTLCDGAPTVLTAEADAGTTLDWDGTGQATLAVSGAGSHTVTGVLGTCSESVDVTVIEQASPTVSVSPGPSIDVCDGEVVTVEASTDIAASIQWTVNGGGVPGTALDVTSVVLAQATAVAGGCPGNTVTLDIAVLPLPTASLSTIPDQLCWGTTGLVTAVPNTGSTVTDWTLPAGTPAPNQAGPGLYTAHLLGDNGCTSSASIALNQLPPIDWALSGPLGECNNAPAALSVTGNHETATWSTGATGNLLELTAADGPGPYEVTVSLGGCTETDQTTIEWWPVPVIGPLPDTVIHCVLDQPEVWSWPAQAETPVGWWVWTVNENVIAGGPAWDTEGDYTIRIFDSMTGCEDTTSVVVDVWPNLDVAAAPLQGIVCWGEETEVLGELRAVEGTNLEEIPYTLSWSEPGIEGLNPTVPAGTYLLTAENACGIAVDVVEVAQEYCGCDMWVPTAFTPDNDGINDGFRVETNCPELDEFRFQVFDRWGELVWSTEDPDAPWVGQGIEGKAMEGQHYIPDGVYGYRLFWKYGELGIPIIEERTGHIHILR